MCDNTFLCNIIFSTEKIILNKLKPQAEKIIAEEQAGFRARRSTTEQIFNLRILMTTDFEADWPVIDSE